MTSVCLEERGVIEQGNGNGTELKPSEYAKLLRISTRSRS
jgi:hypothetical protein